MIEIELMFVCMENETQEYIVSLEQFEGPLDLLCQLIERRKLQINTISLSKITSDYLSYIRSMEGVSAEDTARFVHVASILILIKSKSLLPVLEYTETEEVDVAELEGRVKLFDYIRTHAVPVLRSWERRSWTTPLQQHVQQVVFTPDNSCTVSALKRNADVVVRGLSFFREPPRKHVAATLRIEEVVEEVLAAVADRVSVLFRDIATQKDKKERVISFLAILELVRKNLLMATQDEQFDDIVITKQKEPV